MHTFDGAILGGCVGDDDGAIDGTIEGACLFNTKQYVILK